MASSRPTLDRQWEQFITKYSKPYTGLEKSNRRKIWERNVALIQQHNLDADKGVHSYHLGINEHTDVEDHTKHMCGAKRHASWVPSHVRPQGVHVPAVVDWRDRGYVTRVKFQGYYCGSCWAFSATGSLEGQHFKKTHRLVSLSEQNLVDCSKNGGNDGCNGGFVHSAFEYIRDNGGIDTEAAYPYNAEQCSEDVYPSKFKKAYVGAKVKSYHRVPSGKIDILKEAVATVGPVSVSMDASQKTFQNYERGIYKDDKCRSTFDALNHAVLVVGYGYNKYGEGYWIVKNSWGTNWGIDGYIKIAMANNMAGIATAPLYPVCE